MNSKLICHYTLCLPKSSVIVLYSAFARITVQGEPILSVTSKSAPSKLRVYSTFCINFFPAFTISLKKFNFQKMLIDQFNFFIKPEQEYRVYVVSPNVFIKGQHPPQQAILTINPLRTHQLWYKLIIHFEIYIYTFAKSPWVPFCCKELSFQLSFPIKSGALLHETQFMNLKTITCQTYI